MNDLDTDLGSPAPSEDSSLPYYDESDTDSMPHSPSDPADALSVHVMPGEIGAEDLLGAVLKLRDQLTNCQETQYTPNSLKQTDGWFLRQARGTESLTIGHIGDCREMCERSGVDFPTRVRYMVFTKGDAITGPLNEALLISKQHAEVTFDELPDGSGPQSTNQTLELIHSMTEVFPKMWSIDDGLVLPLYETRTLRCPGSEDVDHPEHVLVASPWLLLGLKEAEEFGFNPTVPEGQWPVDSFAICRFEEVCEEVCPRQEQPMTTDQSTQTHES